MPVYNVSIAESGSAADSPSAQAAFVSAIVEAATIAAVDTVSATGSFNLVISEAAAAADSEDGVDFNGSILLEAGSAIDIISASLFSSDSIAEVADAEDQLNGGGEFLYFDRVKYYTPSLGFSPTLDVASPVVRFQTPAAAGAVEGNICSLLIEQGDDWELDLGVYSAAGVTFSRTFRASSTGSMLNLNGSATVAIVEESAELNYRTPAVPGQYGDTSHIAQFSIDNRGRVTQAASLSAPGIGGMLPLVNGDLPGPSPIADDKGQYIGVPL
jgi:hypothetical protein